MIGSLRRLAVSMTLVLGALPAAARAELVWAPEPALADVLQHAHLDETPLMLVFRADWCGFCRRLDDETLTNPLVLNGNGRWLGARLDIESEEGGRAARRWNVTGLPTILILTPAGTLIDSVTGFRTGVELAQILRQSQSAAVPIEQLAGEAARPGVQPDFVLRAARRLLDAGRDGEALALLDHLEAQVPAASAEAARARVLRASIAERAGKADAAIQTLKEAAGKTQDPGALVEIYTLWISLLRGRGHRAALLATWNEFAGRLPSDPIVQEDCVRGLQDSQAPVPMLSRQAERTLSLKPDSAPALAARALALTTAGNHEAALKEVNRAIELDPKTQAWRILRLQILEKIPAVRPGGA